MLYFGPCSGVVPWFSGQLGYSWQPARHGNPADWAMDLINVGFKKEAARLSSSGSGDAECRVQLQQVGTVVLAHAA
jgi:hypothetical protein